MHGQITRTDLLDLLDRSRDCPITFMVAPAGSGKTTLLSQWRATRADRTVATLSLAPRDNDPMAFFTHLLDAIRSSTEFLDLSTFDLLTVGMAAPADVIADVVLRALALADDELFVVMDDFHHIESPLIQQAVSLLLDSLPPSVHFILSSRQRPRFSLSHFRLDNRLLLVDGSDLRLNREHIIQLNRSLGGHTLPEPSVERLGDLTEGWMVGVKLALLAYSRSGQAALDTFSGTQPELIDYFGHVVLRGLCDQTRQFLLHSAAFERFSAKLCDHVFERLDSAPLIELLLSRGMFVYSLEGQPGWCRYQALLQDFLRSRLAVEVAPEVVRRIHSRAAGYFLAEGDLELALVHGRQCDDDEYFFQVLEQACEEWGRRGDFGNILHWLEAVPEETVIERLALAVPLIFALIFSRRFNQAHYHLDLIKASTRLYPVWKNTSMGVLELSLQLFQSETEFLTALDADLLVSATCHRDIRAFSLVILAYYLMQHGDLAAALATAHKAKVVLTQSGHRFLESYADLIIALCDRHLGRGSDAAACLEQVYARANEHPRTPAWVNIATGMVVVHYELNQLDRARKLCEDLLPMVNYACATEVIATVYLSLARLLHIEGLHRKSARILDQLNRILILGRYERFQSQVAQETMRQALASVALKPDGLKGGELEAIDRIARRYGLPAMVEQSYWRQENRYQECRERYGLTAAYWLMARGDYEEAEKILGRLFEVLDHLGIRARAMIAACNRVRLRFLRGERNAAVALLRQLIDEHGLGCFSRSLFDETPGLEQVFQYARAENALYLPLFYEKFADLLPPESPCSHSQVAPKRIAPKAPLTSREREILDLLLKGLSNSAISGETGVALSTTKWHLKNIYAKLGVANRTGAMVLAMQL